MQESFFSGEVLYGDNFNLEQIQDWFEYEAEAYANLDKEGSKIYSYHVLNKLHGFKFVSLPPNSVALGMGAAYGDEFLPITQYLSEIYIVEPSDQLKAEMIDGISPRYIKPNVLGQLPFKDNSFDIVTCFGTLHHVPNVTYVLSEIYRVTKPNGYILIREPIISMGDWRKTRKGLTKFERGIPLKIFRTIFQKYNLKIIKETPCFTLLFALQRIFKTTLYTKRWYMLLDKYLSKILFFNYHYHAKNKFERLAPTNVFYVLQK